MHQEVLRTHHAVCTNMILLCRWHQLDVHKDFYGAAACDTHVRQHERQSGNQILSDNKLSTVAFDCRLLPRLSFSTQAVV